MKRNCDISDAKEDLKKVEPYFLEHLYRNENEIKPEKDINRKNFDTWIKKKEILWNSIKNKGYSKIEMANKKFDISDNQRINRILIPNGLFYRMIDSVFGKPSFLLAKILKVEKRRKYKILILDKELARDLRTSYYSQCELLHNFIFCRREAERFYLLELIRKINKKSGGSIEKIAKAALQKMDLNLKNLDNEKINKAIVNLMESHIAHEFGHAATRDKNIFQNELFTNLIEKYEGTKIEWFIESIHEVFADTISGGRLNSIVRKRNEGLFGLYVYELLSQYQRHPILRFKMKILFKNSANLKNILQSIELQGWDALEKERLSVYKKTLKIVEKIKETKGNKNKINNLMKELRL